jgi:hypothetical protein
MAKLGSKTFRRNSKRRISKKTPKNLNPEEDLENSEALRREILQ